MRTKCRSIATFHRPIHSHWSLPLKKFFHIFSFLILHICRCKHGVFRNKFISLVSVLTARPFICEIWLPALYFRTMQHKWCYVNSYRVFSTLPLHFSLHILWEHFCPTNFKFYEISSFFLTVVHLVSHTYFRKLVISRSRWITQNVKTWQSRVCITYYEQNYFFSNFLNNVKHVYCSWCTLY
jgi:hypothetical protein